MDLTKITLADFLCDGHIIMASTTDDAFEPTKSVIKVGPLLRTLGKGYALHRFDNQPGDIVLLYEDQPVGCYWGDLLAISSGHQGKKLSVPLILQAVTERSLPTERKLSENGRRALTLGWKVANKKVADPWP